MRARAVALDLDVAGADFNRTADQVIAQVHDHGVRLGSVALIKAFDDRVLRAQPGGEDVQLAQLRVAAVEGVEHGRPRCSDDSCPSAARESDVAFSLGVVRLRRGVRQRAIVDLERHHEIAPRNLFRHQTDGKLARDGALEVHDLESAGLRELGVTVLLPDKPARHNGVGERSVRERRAAPPVRGRCG